MSTELALVNDPYLPHLIATDEMYFRLASSVVPIPGGELTYVSDLLEVPAACVVQAVTFQGSIADAERWVTGVEREIRALGARMSRIYLRDAAPALATVLSSRGYRRRTEIAFCEAPRRVALESAVRFHQARTDADWTERRRMHEEAPDNSDGYTTDPAAWCELIRRKCDTGGKESFLIEHDGHICGSIGAIQQNGMLRLKNIMIRPAFRRRGLALEAVRELASLAQRRGLAAFGVFGIEGEAGAQLYETAGLSIIGAQVEWSKPLASA